MIFIYQSRTKHANFCPIPGTLCFTISYLYSDPYVNTRAPISPH